MSDYQIAKRVLARSSKIEFDLYGAIETHEQYDDLIKVLRGADYGDIIILRINSPGGSAEVGFMVVEAIKKTCATVIANVVWPSMSMASIIACACHALVFNPDTYLMFHTYSSMGYGKSDDLIQDVNESHKSLTEMFRKIITPFLTKKEFASMLDGKDIYVRAGDDNLKERIKRHFKHQDTNG